MLREGIKLPPDALAELPIIIEVVSKDTDVVAFYSFGSLVDSRLNPLSDLDFGILLSRELDRLERFDKHLEFIGDFTSVFKTDEIDLIIMNDAPPRFVHNIIKTGKLLFVRDKARLAEFQEHALKEYLDFKYYRDEFDSLFLKGIGYHG